MMYDVKIADCICRIDLDFFGGTFASWSWKLDPYKVFGVRDSEVDFTIHMGDRAEESCSVSNCICEEHVYHENMGLYEIYAQKLQDGDFFWVFKRRKLEESILEYRVSGDWKVITILKDNSNTAGSLAFEYLRFMIQACLLLKETLTFHGVLLEVDGKGIILSADSGVGKTTRARLLRDSHRAIVLNGDRAVVRKKNGVWTGYGLPWCGSSGEYINREVPISAIVLIERSEHTLIKQEKGILAFSQTLHYVQAPVWDRTFADKAIGMVEMLLEEIPVVKFASPPTVEAVTDLLEFLSGLTSKKE